MQPVAARQFCGTYQTCFTITWLTLKHSSSIIEHVERLCRSSALSTHAYFFFDSRNADNGFLSHEYLIRSLLSQLSYRCGGIPTPLKDSFRAHGDGREDPSLPSLEQTLRTVIEGFDHVYVMIDSLDECGERTELLQWIETVASWELKGLHLLLTSRMEPAIKQWLDLISRVLPVLFRGPELERDIGVYLDERLRVLNRWSEEIRALIKTTLIGRSDGMCVRPWQFVQLELTSRVGLDGSRCRWIA